MGVGGQHHAPAASPPENRLGTQRIGGWVRPRSVWTVSLPASHCRYTVLQLQLLYKLHFAPFQPYRRYRQQVQLVQQRAYSIARRTSRGNQTSSFGHKNPTEERMDGRTDGRTLSARNACQLVVRQLQHGRDVGVANCYGGGSKSSARYVH